MAIATAGPWGLRSLDHRRLVGAPRRHPHARFLRPERGGAAAAFGLLAVGRQQPPAGTAQYGERSRDLLAAWAQGQRDLARGLFAAPERLAAGRARSPTLPDPMDWSSPLRQVALTAAGKPTLARCQDATQSGFRALWPLSLEPWRSPGERRQALLASGCAGEGKSAELQAPIRIVALGEAILSAASVTGCSPRCWVGLASWPGFSTASGCAGTGIRC